MYYMFQAVAAIAGCTGLLPDDGLMFILQLSYTQYGATVLIFQED
jgi:hypothetical protein